jgi:MFS family permease
MTIWFVGTLISNCVVQLAVTLARPVASYRVLALGGHGPAAGLVAASFALPPMLLALSVGSMADRRRPGELLAVGSILVAAAVWLLAGAGSIVVVVLGMMLLGVGHLAWVVAAQTLIAHASSGGDDMGAFGYFTSSASLGQLAGPLIGGLIVSTGGGIHPTLHATTLALAAGGIAAAIAVPLAVALAFSRASPTAPRPPEPEATPQAVRTLFRTPNMLLAMLASFGAKGSNDLVIAYLPLLGASIGIVPRVVGALLSVAAAASIASRALMPFLVRRMSRDVLVVVTTAVSGVGIGLLPASSNLAVLVVLMIVLGMSLALAQTVTMVWIVTLADPSRRGTALGARLAVNRVGQVTVPGVASGVSALAGVASVFLVLAGTLAVIASMLLRTARRIRRSEGVGTQAA